MREALLLEKKGSETFDGLGKKEMSVLRACLAISILIAGAMNAPVAARAESAAAPAAALVPVRIYSNFPATIRDTNTKEDSEFEIHTGPHPLSVSLRAKQRYEVFGPGMPRPTSPSPP
jgi:hypothetical protein